MTKNINTSELPIPSLKTMLALLGEQIESLRPHKKPDRDIIGACRAASTATNSYISGIRLAMDAAKQNGEPANLKFLELSSGKASIS